MCRGIGQGQRCRTCAQLDEERLQAAGNDERFEVAAKKRKHIAEIMADRNVSIRGNRKAEKDAANPSVDGLGQILKITIDGMDQAKFTVPRNLATSSSSSSHACSYSSCENRHGQIFSGRF